MGSVHFGGVRRFAEVGEAECATLLLEEIAEPSGLLQRAFGLTPREAEVLFWIAQAKRNPEIASILDKMQAENRLTATRLANEAIMSWADAHGATWNTTLQRE